MTLVDMALKINNMNNSNALAFVTQHLIGKCKILGQYILRYSLLSEIVLHP